ncbi:hypothetical protein BGC33_04625 [Bathymodiolus thermophilus thioautotrophic gill symbiont]|uniref:Uncharacterized protein n=1 Tax=Bathymodiolus thermophilus thioautotrophic gill symbiont TaxID=2360 RepID=A0A1J5TVD9_9GAMM|nr:hypothetical protein BGC33_04625 [Bathymodiolus thermophilus thioautotrophic gill symbiont]
MVSSVSGGIATELGRGKFANGERSAAFVSLYNHNGSAYKGDKYSVDDNQGGYFHKVPLESFTPILDLFGGGMSIKFIVKTPIGRTLCASVILYSSSYC